MNYNIQPGMMHELEQTVTKEMLASAFGSGRVEVFATPCLILAMEAAAAAAVEPVLGEELTTVGTIVNIEHCAPTPIGMTIWSEAVLTEIDGRRLVFDVCVRDEKEIVGRGTHERVIVDKARFNAKANAKRG